jgi:HK97 gp10 family phage protein
VATRVRIFEGALTSLTEKAAVELVGRALDAGVGAAQRLVPIDTGALQGSIGVVAEAAATGDGGAAGAYGTSVEYALHVEFGTSKMSAQPYLRPSVDAVGVAAGGP